MQFSANFLPSPLSSLLEFSGLIRTRHPYTELDHQVSSANQHTNSNSENDGNSNETAEVSIRILNGGESERPRPRLPSENEGSTPRDTEDGAASSSRASASVTGNVVRSIGIENDPQTSVGSEENAVSIVSGTAGNRDTVSQRYDFQQLARCIEQVLPFTILLLMVFIRQHIRGFLVTFWISAVMVKGNDLLRKQTALKGERNVVVLLAISAVLLTHFVAVYCFYWGEDILRPLFMVPPRNIPKFWQAIFIIIVNDTMARHLAMVTKCLILICYKNSRGRPYRQQAHLLTVIEYVLLLYRALLPAPVWYRFFLNKEYGNVFSSLTTGLYLTFKLTTTLEKVQRFFAAVKMFSRKEVQYGSSATCEEVLAAGDMCAICQEKMHAPILLRCKHIFCEDVFLNGLKEKGLALCAVQL